MLDSYFLTDRQLRELDDSVAAGIVSIAGRIHQRTIMAADGVNAWGQYLDERYNGQQWGLLGTSAACQALVLAEPSADPYVKRNSTGQEIPTDVALARPILFSDRGNVSQLLHRQVARRELDNIVRLASVAEALLLDREVIAQSQWPSLVRDIVGCRDPHAWWSSESAGPVSGAQTGDPFVTAFVVHALRRYEDNRQFDDVRLWLIDCLGGAAIQRRLDLISLIGLALVGRGDGSHDRRILDGIARCQRMVIARRGPVRHPTVERPLFVGYAVDDRTDYAFLNPEQLAALFLLRSGNPTTGRRFVLRTVKATASSIPTGKGFETELGGEATVEQLWAMRLLREYIDRAQSKERRGTVRPTYSLTRRAGIFLMSAIVLLGTALVLAVAEDELGATVAFALGGLIAILGVVFAPGD